MMPPHIYAQHGLAGPAEARALFKAAKGREHDLRHLVRMALLQARNEIKAWTAAGIIADEICGENHHAFQKTLHRKFRQAPALYQRLALAGGDPAEAARRAERAIYEMVRKQAEALPPPTLEEALHAFYILGRLAHRLGGRRGRQARALCSALYESFVSEAAKNNLVGVVARSDRTDPPTKYP